MHPSNFAQNNASLALWFWAYDPSLPDVLGLLLCDWAVEIVRDEICDEIDPWIDWALAAAVVQARPDTPRVVSRHPPGVPPFFRTVGDGHR
jgi:hypothetical protein